MKASLRSVKSTGGCILGETNLCMYNDVGKICEQLPALQDLNLSNNLVSPYKSELPPLESIRILVLNDTGVDWQGYAAITLKCVGASMGEKQPFTKKLPATTTVGKLKFL
ncbi:hypothetical protein S83_011451 [Arachis hypogaea]